MRAMAEKTGVGSLHALILAGGSGTRLWPRSTDAAPKPFLALGGGASLIRQSYLRALAAVRAEGRSGAVWFSARASHAPLLAAEFPEVPASRMILEPARRNTAAAIALSALAISRVDPGGVLVVLPSDQGIQDDAAFVAALGAAAEAARESDSFVTIGIEPTRPETGYGYLETDPAETGAEAEAGAAPASPPASRSVVRFVEKPPLEEARRYLASGRFLWNAGIFVFRIPVLLAAMEEHCPDILSAVRAAAEASARGDEPGFVRAFGAARSQSIDFAVMERVKGVRTVPCSCGWSDVGSWEAVYEFLPRDAQGNVVEGGSAGAGGGGGSVSFVESSGNLVLASGKPVCVIGLSGIAIVDSPNGLLVTRRGASDELRAYVERELARGGAL
jgi:mannose-1-phosphate guanylyltransferase